MSDTNENTRDVWNFYKFRASQPKAWLNEAFNLRCACELLLQHNDMVLTHVFKKDSQVQFRAAWYFGVARMLMGFALENLIKAILLQNPEKLKQAFAREGNLSWDKDGHNLFILFEQAGVEIKKDERPYLELWQTSSIWAGRYPIPKNENQLPPLRKALSEKNLSQRQVKRIRKSIKEGDQTFGITLFDRLHTGIGSHEWNTFDAIYERCRNKISFIQR